VGQIPVIAYFSDSSFESNIGYTYYEMGEDRFFAGSDIIQSEYIPPNGIFSGWFVEQMYDYSEGNNLFNIGDIVQPGAVYNTDTYYGVYPIWNFPPPFKQMHYTDNSRIFYKPGSLAPGGIGTVRNSRHKAKHI